MQNMSKSVQQWYQKDKTNLKNLPIDNVMSSIEPLKTKYRRLYLKTQSVPRCKHFSSLL